MNIIIFIYLLLFYFIFLIIKTIFIWLNFNIRRLSIKLFFYATELIIKYITEKGKKIGIILR